MEVSLASYQWNTSPFSVRMGRRREVEQTQKILLSGREKEGREAQNMHRKIVSYCDICWERELKTASANPENLFTKIEEKPT